MDVLFKGGSLLYTQLSTAARMALLLPRYVYANVAGSSAAAEAQPHPGMFAVLAVQASTLFTSAVLPSTVQHLTDQAHACGCCRRHILRGAGAAQQTTACGQQL
jgi:hypothetical protein